MQKQNCLRVDNFAFVDIARSSSSVGSRISISSPSFSSPPHLPRKKRAFQQSFQGSFKIRRRGTDFAPKSGFFLGFRAHSAIGVLAFALSGTDFDQAFMAASQKSGQAKLTHENDTRAARIVEQNQGAIV
jgi:hypothetical protein